MVRPAPLAAHRQTVSAHKEEFEVGSTRFLVEYSDQNESFARFLPRAGQVIRDFSDTAGNSGWYLLELDQPFDYQIKVGEPYQFRGTTITHFLIRSRWLGHALGGPEPVSVFVLLVEDGSVPTQGPIEVKHYFHAAWGMCRVPPDGA